MTSLIIDIQNATGKPLFVNEDTIEQWAKITLGKALAAAELSLRFVDKTEIQILNRDYRHMDKPTNVLAFPVDIPEEVQENCPLLGDVIICPEVLMEESLTQKKDLSQHWAHITIHGLLHLLGYDHIEEDEAKEMQEMEITCLNQLGFSNPYGDGEGNE